MEIFQIDMYLASDSLTNKIFIFNHIRFEHLYNIIRNKGIVINGGSHNRRHILKSNDIKLTLVLRTLLFLIENLTYPRKPFKFEDYDSRLIELSHKSFANNQFKKKKDFTELKKVDELYAIIEFISPSSEFNKKTRYFDRKFCESILIGLFNTTVHTGGLHMSIKPEMSNYLNELLKEIDKRMSYITEISTEIKKIIKIVKIPIILVLILINFKKEVFILRSNKNKIV
uniref:Uncharacterized protein n=1 Tax=Ganoderma leucocontextum TaxID=1566825 RepID=A0A2S1WBG8_9APHY|nr:hypothetical protein [Ganoderma leucocontextum]AWJ63933.1 hypothetical protein [Ganoderma leucocontextum]